MYCKHVVFQYNAEQTRRYFSYDCIAVRFVDGKDYIVYNGYYSNAPMKVMDAVAANAAAKVRASAVGADVGNVAEDGAGILSKCTGRSAPGEVAVIRLSFMDSVVLLNTDGAMYKARIRGYFPVASHVDGKIRLLHISSSSVWFSLVEVDPSAVGLVYAVKVIIVSEEDWRVKACITSFYSYAIDCI